MERLTTFVHKGINHLPFVLIFVLFLSAQPVKAQDAFMGYDYVSATYPLAWTTTPTTFNAGTASEIIYTMSGGALFTATVCGTSNINGYQINASAAFIEMQLTANSTTSTITDIAFTGSTNNNTTAGDAGIVFSDQYPFNETSVISATAVTFPAATGSWIVLNPTIPAGAKSMRIYRRIYYNSSTLTISTSTGTGFVQYGTGTTIRLASMAVTLAVSGTAPTVTTTSVTDITQTTASSGGNVTDAGTGTVTVRGVCWSTLENPTIADDKTEDGSGTGSYTSSITGLIAGTTYYVRAYATSTVGTSYGGQETFNSLPGVADIVLSSDNPAVPITNITAGTLKNPVYKFNLAVTIAITQLNQVDFTTQGTYTSSDVSKLQLWFNTEDNLGAAVQIGTDITSSLGGISNLSFISLTQDINAGETGYLWITADVSETATPGSTFYIDAVNTSGLTFASGNKSGTAFNGGVQTIVEAANPDVYFRTKATGDWNVTSTWETSLDSLVWIDALLTPTNASKYIHVRSPHTVTVTETVSVDQVIVDQGATIIVNGTPVVFTIVDGPDGIDMLVNGLLKSTGIANASPGPHTVNAQGILQFGSTGVYEHEQNAGAIPISIWGTGSTMKLTGTTGTAPANRNQSFYNLVFDTPGLVSNLNMGFDEVTIGGNINIINTGASNRWYLCGPVASDTVVVTINGDIIQTGGQFSAQGTSSALSKVEITVLGDIIVTGGNFACTRGTQSQTGTTNWYLYGENFSMSDATTQNSNTNDAKFLFSGTTQQNLTLTNVTFSGGFPFEVATNAILDVGTSQVAGSGIFTLNDDATLQTANTGGLDGLLQNTGTITLSTSANYTFNGTEAQITGSLLPTIVNNLTIDNAAGDTLSGDVTVNGTLSVNNGDLHLDGKTVTLGTTAMLVETSGNTVTDVLGKIRTTRDINAPSGLNVGGLGAMLTSTENLGSTVIERYHYSASEGGNEGIFRAFNIVPTNNTSLNATLRFYYDESELNGISETDLTLFKSPTGSNNTWTSQGGTVNLTDNYVELSSIGDFSYWTLAASATTTFQLTVGVSDGWNMVSVPGINPDGQGVSTWWGGRNTLADVYKWNGTYTAVTSATPTEGYWMLHTGANTYNTGDEWPAGGIQIVAHDPIAITTGWNMIGGYDNSALVSGLTTTPAGLIVAGTVYGWNGSYYNPTNLVPGYGYWLLSSGAGVINSPTLAKGTSKLVAQDNKEEWGKITITDAAGKSYVLYAVNGEVNLESYQLPPLPPTGTFDVRYSSGKKAEKFDKEMLQNIEMSGITYPVKVRVEKVGIRLQDETGKIVNERLKTGEEITISNSSVSKLMVSADLIPVEYALEQNYPNPFNPSTKIEFSLPEDVNNVTLTIYNALGQRVAELINSKLEAGYHSFVWNAGNVATGMYIYELRTDKFVSVKKMLLLK